jgi:lysozyme family protein
MKENLERCLNLTFNHEQGYVNHPNDPGGPTNHGVTIRTLAAARGRKVSIDDVKRLSKEEAKQILIEMYWKPIRGDELPSGLDYAVFDFGVNSGPARAVMELQKLVGTAQDGIMGPKTLAAVKNYPGGTEKLIQDYCAARLDYCDGLRTWGTFGRGWTRRITGIDPLGKLKPQLGVVGESIAMLEGYHPKGIDATTEADATGAGKARDGDKKISGIPGAAAKGAALAAAIAAAANQVADVLSTTGGVALPVSGGVMTIAVIVGIVAGAVVDIKKMRGPGADA